jgi:dienelactone hydrolase
MTRFVLLLTLLTPLLVHAAVSATRPAPCPYATAHDAPLEATETFLDKTDTYSRYRVEFNGIERGTRVPGYLYIPANAKPKNPGILMQYGSGGNKKTNYIVALDQMFAAHGFVVLTIDIPQKGDRRTPGIHPIFEGHFLQTLGDYGRAVDYLAQRPEVDSDRLAYGGISWGAITGITYVAHDPRIKVMASLVGGGNFLGWLPGKIDDEVRKNVEQYDPVFHVGLIAPRPLLLLNVKHDLLIAPFLSESLHKAAGANATRIWLDTDHIFSTVDRVATSETVIKFIQDHLPRAK